MAKSVDRKVSNFVGRRSLARIDAKRADRLQLVGLASVQRLPLGAHLLRSEGTVPGPIDGHVTSSFYSQTLGRPIALGIVRSGRLRTGESVDVYDTGDRYHATIVDPVFIDRDGKKLRE